MYLAGLTGGVAPQGDEAEFTKRLLEKAGIMGAGGEQKPNAASAISENNRKTPEEEKIEKLNRSSSPPRSLSPLLDEALGDVPAV
jgi:hypothetical protein